ncbi:MAG: ERCC4 domain-containing protein [bacterium]
MINILTTLPYHYTNTELKKLLKSITVLVDTREKSNNHIIKYFDSKNMPYKSKKLDYGDYSFYLPVNKDLGINRDMYFNNNIVIERKANLEELSNNLTHDRTQFENELIRASNSKFVLLIENAKGYEDIINHNYNTDYKPKSFVATLHAFKARYNIEVIFIDPAYSGNYIFYAFYYYLRELLKG